MHTTLLGLLGDDAVNHVLAAYYKATILPPPLNQSAVRKKGVYFEMVDTVARANKRLHKLSRVVQKVAIEKIRAAFFAEIVNCALPMQVSKCKGFNLHLYHNDETVTSCFVCVVWNRARTMKEVNVYFSHSPMHSKAARHAILALECKGEVVAGDLLHLPMVLKPHMSPYYRETRFTTHDYYAIAQAERTEAQQEDVAVHQKEVEVEMLAWLDNSFRDLNAHDFWRTRNHVDLGVF
jgi:hypothetical protein